ncbi:MAG: peptidase domain-containing ABC transporter [Bacteroidia bacterium]
MEQAFVPLSPMRRFFRLLAKDRKEMGLLYIYAIANGIIALSLPLGIQAIIGFTLANELSSSWGILVAIVTLGTLLAGALLIMQRAIVERLQQNIFARASFEFAYRIPRLKREALMKYYPPELVNRFFDTLNLQKGLPKILIDFITAVLQIIFGMILLSFYHPLFVFFGIGLLLLLVVIIRFTGNAGLQSSLNESDYKYKVAHWLEEIARTLITFRLAGRSNLALNRTDDLVCHYLDARKKHFRILVFQYSSIVVFKTIITAALLILGSVLLIQREINIGQFVASEIVIILIINSVEKLVMSADTVYDVLTATEKLGKVTDLPLEDVSQVSEGDILPAGQGMALRLQNLSFTYPDDRYPALKDLNVEIKAQDKICIMGPNGSGKTLLLNIVSGLYEQLDGVMTYEGIPRGRFDPFTLRDHVGDCLSQQKLFKGTIRENLTMGKPYVKEEDLRWALDSLHLTDFVQSLPKGLETEIVPESSRWPQSVVRKMILAQAVAQRPRLLVVDNLFTALEPEDRRRIADFLAQTPIWTLIVVSHEPYLAHQCDRVLLLDQGELVANAPYSELEANPIINRLIA